MKQITWDDFANVEIRVGTITDVQDFPKAKKLAYILTVNFGPEVGIKKSSAQITVNYSREELVGKKVVGVVNFPPKQIGPVMSECLITGFTLADGSISLCVPDSEEVANGMRLV